MRGEHLHACAARPDLHHMSKERCSVAVVAWGRGVPGVLDLVELVCASDGAQRRLDPVVYSE